MSTRTYEDEFHSENWIPIENLESRRRLMLPPLPRPPRPKPALLVSTEKKGSPQGIPSTQKVGGVVPRRKAKRRRIDENDLEEVIACIKRHQDYSLERKRQENVMGQLHALMEKEGQVPPGTTIHRKIQSKIRAKINELEGIGRTRGNKGFTELEQCYDVLRKT